MSVGNEKSGKRLFPRVVLSVDTVSGSITVPGSESNKSFAAVEDVRFALIEDDFAMQIEKWIDAIEDSILEAFESTCNLDRSGTDDCDISLDDESGFDPVFVGGGSPADLKVGDSVEVN